MTSPEFGLSYTYPHTDVFRLKTETVQVGGESFQRSAPSKPSLPSSGAYLEGFFPIYTSDTKVFSLLGTAGAGFSAVSNHQSASWNGGGVATYHYPNTYVRFIASVGYGGWTTATQETDATYHGVLGGVGIAAKLPVLSSFDISVYHSWRTDFDNTQSMFLLGLRYFLDRELPPIVATRDAEKVDVHVTIQRASDRLREIRTLSGYPLRQRIADSLKEDGADPNSLEEQVKLVAQYFTWVRNPDKEQVTLNLTSIARDMALVNASQNYVRQLVDIGSHPFDTLYLNLEDDKRVIPNALAQHGLDLLFQGEDNLYARIQKVGIEARDKINASLHQTAREHLERYKTLLDLVESTLNPAILTGTPPHLRAQLSPSQREAVEKLLRQVTCLKTGQGCRPVADEAIDVTVPRLEQGIVDLQARSPRK